MGYKTYTCPIAKNCGGCEWLAVPYPIQLKRKQAAMDDLFAPFVKADNASVNAICGMDEPTAYRHKAATPFAPGSKNHIRSGFYAAGTHRIVACEKCLVEEPQARSILNDVASSAERLGIRAYQEDRGRGVLRHAVVRCGYATDDVLLTLVTNGQQLPREKELVEAIVSHHPEITTIVQNVNQRRTNAILGHECRTLFGPGIMHDRLLGCTFEIGPTSFYQTNPAQTEVLYSLAIEAAGLSADARGTDPVRVLDAYCGTGTIGICVASQVENAQVTGVEQVGAAIACAKRNAKANNVQDRTAFVAADATEEIRRLAQGGRDHFDVVIMDPPRAGSTPAFLDSVAALGAKTVAYVSCNPVTQARDIEHLRKRGYRLDWLTPVDMFPHTKHVETVARLVRA